MMRRCVRCDRFDIVCCDGVTWECYVVSMGGYKHYEWKRNDEDIRINNVVFFYIDGRVFMNIVYLDIDELRDVFGMIDKMTQSIMDTF